ncbi:hypothetical protein TM4_37 [Mycobacterium phage TM4]|uniref:Uncharacterized protein n=1 Tax=Mycobacterium phage TM4 TaxID=88870 RepID=Q9ZX41_BPMT4|nr:hypothetical protein TM4_gp37 [Mycobacterium phage TM4]AAD17604.1 hypothetical protein TM4_37 [Mycobacterium phage TM4]
MRCARPKSANSAPRLTPGGVSAFLGPVDAPTVLRLSCWGINTPADRSPT